MNQDNMLNTQGHNNFSNNQNFNNIQYPNNNKSPKKFNLGLIISVATIATSIVIGGILILTNNKKDGNNNINLDSSNTNISANSKLSINDILPIEKAINNLNWYYTTEDMTDVWNVNVDIISNKIQSYTNAYASYNSQTLYSMYLTGLINNNSNSINIKFDVENKETYKENHKYIISYYTDFKYYEDQYKDYDIITNNYDNMIRLYKEITPNYYFTILITKNIMTDNLENYKEYYKNLVDTIILKKLNKNAFKDTSYLTLYPMGWHSNGGGHFYLNSKRVKIDDMTLVLEGYSVANVNLGIVIKDAWKGHYDYAIKIMKDKPTYIEAWDKEVYFNFDIIYVSNKSKDNTIKDYLIENKYEISNKKINGYDFIFYNAPVKNTDYFIYETEDGYYLFDFGSNYDLKEYTAEFNNILK